MRPGAAPVPAYVVNTSGLERNRGGDLECISLEGRSALEFVKILKTETHLLLAHYCVYREPKSVDFVVRGSLFRRNLRATFIGSLPLAVAH